MTIPITIPTGKANMLASLRDYMQTNLPGSIPSGNYDIEWEQYENAESYPSISFEDVGIPSVGGHAFDDFIGVGTNDANQSVNYYGKKAQTLVEFNCQTNLNDSNTAIQDCYQMRDQIEYMLMYSGKTHPATGAQMLPPILLNDYSVNPPAFTGGVVEAPMERDSIWMEQFIGTDINRAGIKRLAIRVRIYWHLLIP